MTIRLRLAQVRDAADILAIYAPYCESTTVTFEVVPPSLATMEERITRIRGEYPWIIGELNGRVAGYVYASRFRERAAYKWTAEAAIYVAMDSQRRGLGHAMYSALFSILRAQGFFKAVAGITLPNPASVGLHERFGFRQTGIFPAVGHKDGTWLDVGWWQLALQPEVLHPPDPRPFSDLQTTESVTSVLENPS